MESGRDAVDGRKAPSGPRARSVMVATAFCREAPGAVGVDTGKIRLIGPGTVTIPDYVAFGGSLADPGVLLAWVSGRLSTLPRRGERLDARDLGPLPGVGVVGELLLLLAASSIEAASPSSSDSIPSHYSFQTLFRQIFRFFYSFRSIMW